MAARARRAKPDPWKDRPSPVKEDMRLQRATWRAQAIGWAALGLFLVAALLGAFSQGPLSGATATSDGGGLAVEYQRLQRSGAGDTVVVRVLSLPEDEALTIGIGRSFLQANTIESVSPTPAEAATGADGIALTYPPPTGLPAEIHLAIRPHRAGLSRGAITLNGRETARLTQFTYP
jgi:hypothetical protein